MKQRTGKKISEALGQYLASVRAAKGMTLRQVEEATGGEVSNAYLSQLEHGRISKPSPNMLHSLAEVYGVAYETLMEKAGYIFPRGTRGDDERHGRAVSFSAYNLTREEEEELLKYLGYIRSKNSGRGKS